MCGKIGPGKTTLVKKLILNGVLNKKNYIEPFQKECKKSKNLSFRHDRLQLGKEYSGFRYPSKRYRKILAQLSAQEHLAGGESVRPYYSSLIIFDDLFMQLMSSETFLAHLTSVRQHGIHDVMLTEKCSGKDIFCTINMNVDNFLLMSLADVPTRLKSFLYDQSSHVTRQRQIINRLLLQRHYK